MNMQEEPASRPKLSFDQANVLCREFLQVGQAVFDYMDGLQRFGFSAFMPHHDFIQSFCAAEESEVHRLCLIESAKNLLGRPWPFPVSQAEERLLYLSPFIQRLNQERDSENGVPVSRLSSCYPGEIWRIEIDPCQRRRAHSSVKDRQTYNAQWAAVQKEQRHRLELETARHATDLSRCYTFDRRQRYAFFTAVMKRDTTTLGFEFDSLKSRPDYPVFSKQINETWDICWVLEEAKAFYSNFAEGRFAPYLEIRNRNLIGSIENGNSGEFLFIRYHQIVPGFSNAYGKFSKLEELETMIKAHLCLYGLMAPIIEGGAKRTLLGGHGGIAR
jgi:hypothetical protein